MCELDRVWCPCCGWQPGHVLYPCAKARGVLCDHPAGKVEIWCRLMTCTSTDRLRMQEWRPRICEHCISERAWIAAGEHDWWVRMEIALGRMEARLHDPLTSLLPLNMETVVIHGNPRNNFSHIQLGPNPGINGFPMYWTILRFRQAADEIRTRENKAEAIRVEKEYKLWEQTVRSVFRDIDPFNTAAEYLEDEANQVLERGLTAWIRDDSSPTNDLPRVEGPYGEIARQGEIWSFKMNKATYNKMLATPEGAGISCRVDVRLVDRLRFQPLTNPATSRDCIVLGSSAWLNIEGVVRGHAQAIGSTQVIYHPSQFCYCPAPGCANCPCGHLPASFRVLRWDLFQAWLGQPGNPGGAQPTFWRMIREMNG
ncbi:hypothetical protein GE09DRAFT_181126 [Coniochaeta sp. 2T2.1]|nr:hypothetical protein GE09DRAFT_181126 [Coniochaeta sp. 2T2.1]